MSTGIIHMLWVTYEACVCAGRKPKEWRLGPDAYRAFKEYLNSCMAHTVPDKSVYLGNLEFSGIPAKRMQAEGCALVS